MTKKNKLTKPHPVRDFFAKVVLLVGALFFTGVLLYPFVADALNTVLDQAIIDHYKSEIDKKSEAQREKEAEKKAKEERLLKEALKDPFSEESLAHAKVKSHSTEFYTKHTIGVVYIPTIQQNLPIFDNSAEDFLARGAAWLAYSSYPKGGVNRHSVISAHRGLPSASLFTELDKVKKRDVFILEIGNRYLAYKVKEISVVEPTDVSKTLAVKGKDLCTLLTCTPYMRNTHRLLVTGERIPFTPNMMHELANTLEKQKIKANLMFVLVGGILLFALWTLLHWVKRMIILGKKYDIRVKFVDMEEPLSRSVGEISYGLFDAKGKRHLKRNGENYICSVDTSTGDIIFDHLYGRNYVLKPIEENSEEYDFPTIFCKVKRIRSSWYSVKFKKKQKARLKFINKYPVVYLPRKGGDRK